LVFGIGRGLVIVGLAYIAFAMLVPLRDHPMALTEARLYPLIQDTSEVLLELVPGLNKGEKEGGTRTASQNETQPQPSSGEQTGKTYGVSERRALDRLIEATGRNQDSSR
jgi:membrane protein required for colicin V production